MMLKVMEIFLNILYLLCVVAIYFFLDREVLLIIHNSMFHTKKVCAKFEKEKQQCYSAAGIY